MQGHKPTLLGIQNGGHALFITIPCTNGIYGQEAVLGVIQLLRSL